MDLLRARAGVRVELSVSDRQINLRSKASERARGHRVHEKSFCLSGQERDTAGRSDERHNRSQIVHFMGLVLPRHGSVLNSGQLLAEEQDAFQKGLGTDEIGLRVIMPKFLDYRLD